MVPFRQLLVVTKIKKKSALQISLTQRILFSPEISASSGRFYPEGPYNRPEKIKHIIFVAQFRHLPAMVNYKKELCTQVK